MDRRNGRLVSVDGRDAGGDESFVNRIYEISDNAQPRSAFETRQPTTEAKVRVIGAKALPEALSEINERQTDTDAVSRL